MEIDDGIKIVDLNGTKMLPISSQATNNMDFVNSWFLMGSPLPVSIILVSYLLFVLKIGPEFMKKREPYKLENILRLYNAFQVIISLLLFIMCVDMIVNHGLLPKTCVMETEYSRRRIASAMHYYFLAKISELPDTIFFILRKKEKQVSFLHVYHHSLMVLVTWMALKYEPTYALIFLGLLNSFVHVIMYTYYGLSSFPNMAKYLWWKKYITSMQLIQFVLILIHFGLAIMKSECTPSYIMSTAMAANGILFLYLFGSFYVTTYKKKSSAKTDKSKEMKMDNGTEDNLYEVDKKIYQNGAKLSNGFGKMDNETNFTSASITLNDTYRIRFNMDSKKQ